VKPKGKEPQKEESEYPTSQYDKVFWIVVIQNSIRKSTTHKNSSKIKKKPLFVSFIRVKICSKPSE
jgi:hypothetical protein